MVRVTPKERELLMDVYANGGAIKRYRLIQPRARSRYYQDVLIQRLRNMEKKGLVELKQWHGKDTWYVILTAEGIRAAEGGAE